MSYKRIPRGLVKARAADSAGQKAVLDQQHVFMTGAAKLLTKTFREAFPHTAARDGKRSKRTGSDIPDHLLRHLAGVYYAADPRGCSVLEMTKDPLFSGCAYDMLRRWSMADGWREQREEFWKAADETVRRRIAKELSTGRLRDLEKLQLVQAHAFDLLLNRGVRPSTWEGVANAAKRVTETIDKLREKLAKDENLMPPSLPDPGSEGESGTPALRVSLSEAREAAQFLLQRRMQKQLLSVAEKEGAIHPESDEDEIDEEEEGS